jgi:hypothetical protein
MRAAQAMADCSTHQGDRFFRQGKVVFPFSKRPESGPKVNRRVIGSFDRRRLGRLSK